MLLGCCHCGTEQSSSVSSSAGASSASEGSGGASASVASESASQSSDSNGLPTVACNQCSTGNAPYSWQMEWTLVNNCPFPTGSLYENMEVGCYDQAAGPHYGIASCDAFLVNLPNCPPFLYEEGGCFWENYGDNAGRPLGEVTITRTGYGTCGQCASAPWIGISVRKSDGTYYIDCFVIFQYNCSHGDPAIAEHGFVFLWYQKASSMPMNCEFEQQLDLFCYDAFDEFTDPPGTSEWGGVGPGCNFANQDTHTFPTTVTIRRDTGGGTFP
jgi:hypothetical protein